MRSDYEAGPVVEYQVVGMTGRPRESGIYTGPDALERARKVQQARGGRIRLRVITQWKDWRPE